MPQKSLGEQEASQYLWLSIAESPVASFAYAVWYQLYEQYPCSIGAWPGINSITCIFLNFITPNELKELLAFRSGLFTGNWIWGFYYAYYYGGFGMNDAEI